MKLFRKILSDKGIEQRYVRSGAIFGDAVSYIYLGECIGFEKLLTTWDIWEEEYARRGFRTISLDRFVDLGGYGRSVNDVLGIKREPTESPIYHARIYREKYLRKITPVIDLEKMMQDGEPQIANYNLPSTEEKKK